jgi:hypothetical protein
LEASRVARAWMLEPEGYAGGRSKKSLGLERWSICARHSACGPSSFSLAWKEGYILEIVRRAAVNDFHCGPVRNHRRTAERALPHDGLYRSISRSSRQWDDFDFDKNQLLVQRSLVSGRVADVKTEYSQDCVPLHPSLTEIELKWAKEATATEDGWVFANPITKKPYYPTEIQKRHIRPADSCLGCLVPPRRTDAEWQAAAGPS